MCAAVTVRGDGPDPGGLVDALVAAGFDVGPTSAVTVTVLDTFDGRLHDVGLRLEHRDAILVLHGDNTVSAHVSAPAASRFAADLAPGPFRNRLGAITDVRALLPLVTVSSRLRRAERRNGDGKVVAVAAIHDRVSTDHGDVAGWYAEIDDLTGYDKQSATLRDLVVEADAHPIDTDVVGVAMASAGIDPAGYQSDPSVPLDPQLPALEGFRLVLANLADAIEANRAGTIDDVDPEFLHEFRVAVRRTRSVLGHGTKVLPADVLAWSRPDLKSLGDITSPPRDLDVYVLEWDTYVDDLPGPVVRALQPVRDQLGADRAAAHDELTRQLRSDAIGGLLARWRAWVTDQADPALGGPHADRPVIDVVRRRIEKAQARLLEHGRTIRPTTAAEEVHELRKDAKKLRYLFECFGGLLPSSERKAFVKRLKALQDNLGEHQDAEVHVAQLRRIVGELPVTTPPETYVAIGQLIEQLDQRRQDARDTFAERFGDYDRAKTHRAFEAVLDGAGG